MQKIKLHPGETIEELGINQRSIIQDKHTYRFSLDSLLLANFVKIKNQEKIIDLGTGCGIIPLMIYDPKKKNTIYGVEIQQKLSNLALRNVVINNMEDRVHILHADARHLRKTFKGESFNVVISNPPYMPIGKGKPNISRQQLLARHEINMTIEDIMSICLYLLKKRGRLYLIHRADNFIPVVMSLKQKHMEPKLLQFVFTKKNDKAKRFLIEARKEGGTELTVLPPLFVNH